MPPGHRRDDGRFFGVATPRQHFRPDQRLIQDGNVPFAGVQVPPGPPPPAPPAAMSSANDAQRMMQNAYMKGRQDERIDTREELTLDAIRANQSRPQIVQRTRPTIRGARPIAVDPEDFRRPRDLLLEDHRMMRDLELRRQRGSIVSDDPWAGDLAYLRRERRASDYMGRRELPLGRGYEMHDPNPFSPQPRRARAYHPRAYV
jgi:hypothetical protein